MVRSSMPPAVPSYRNPGDLFRANAHAVPAPMSQPMFKLKDGADWLAEADAKGIEIRRTICGRTNRPRFGAAGHGITGPAVELSPALAAERVLRLMGTKGTLPAQSWWRVSGWLASELADAGEAVVYTVGGAIWGCTEARLDPNNHPVLCALFETHISQRARILASHEGRAA